MGWTRADAFPSEYLKADDFKPEKGGPQVWTIREMTRKEVLDEATGKEKMKYYLWFEEDKRCLGLNVTNWLLIEAMYGDNLHDEWMGKRVKLYTTKVPFGNGLVDAVRILPPDNAAPVPTEADVIRQTWAKFYVKLTPEQQGRVETILGGKPTSWLAKTGKSIEACIGFVKAALMESDEPKDEIPFD